MKKLYMLLFFLVPALAAQAQNCSNQFAGGWFGSDNCSVVGSFTYTSSVDWYENRNSADVDTFLVKNFGGTGNTEYVMVIADCNSETLTVPFQTLSTSWTVVGTGSFTGSSTMQISYTLANGGSSYACSSTYQRTSNTSSINETEKQKLRCYPNPSESIINVEIGNEASKVEVYNTMGQLVASESAVKGIYSLSNETIGTGTFFIRVINDKATKTSAVIMK